MRNYLFLIGIVFLFVGCIMGKVYYDYSIEVKNLGIIELIDVEITSQKGFWHETGYVVKGSSAGIGSPQPTPPNDIYTIKLTRENVATIEHIVDLRDAVEKGFRGWITFTINDENEVSYLLERKRRD